MSRYLNPSRLGVLALALLYVEDFVPVDSTVPVLSLIVSYLLPPRSPLPMLTNDQSLRDSSASTEAFYKILCRHVSSIPGRTLWDIFLEKLWTIDSLDTLHIFFYSLASRVRSIRDERPRDVSPLARDAERRLLLSRRSPIGILFRRAQLEFNRLQLRDVVKLWKAFTKFKEPTLIMWRKRSSSVRATNLDMNIVSADVGSNTSLTKLLHHESGSSETEMVMSMSEITGLLELQIDQIQKLGVYLPNSIKSTLDRMIGAGAITPNLSHYVKFLESWKAGDYPSSFDHLHRYFDYTMQDSDRTLYQYALLNLAIMHADFGCFSEAISTMQETIATARENKDMVCLNYSLSWLFTFSKAYPEGLQEMQKGGTFGTENEILMFLKSKAKETKMWSLLSACLLGEARASLSHGDDVATALDNLTQASKLNALMSVPNGVGSQMIMQGSVFGRLGYSWLAWSLEDLFLECYARQAPAEETLHYYISLAYKSALKGRYKESLDVLNGISQETLWTMKSQHHWVAHMGLMDLHKCLRGGDLYSACYCLKQIRAVPAPDQAFAFALSFRELELQMLQGKVEHCMLGVTRAISKLEVQGTDIYQCVKMMTLKARCYQQFNMSQKAISVALRAASLAYSIRVAPVLWEAIEIVAKVMLSLSEFEATSRLLECVIPQVLECEDCELTGTCIVSIADAHMGTASQSKGEAPWKVREKMIRAMGFLEKAEMEFVKLGNVKKQREVLAKKGIILMHSGDKALATDCAARYLDVRP